jgi:hypothetical protein
MGSIPLDIPQGNRVLLGLGGAVEDRETGTAAVRLLGFSDGTF